MKFKFTAQVLATALTLSGAVPFTANAIPPIGKPPVAPTAPPVRVAPTAPQPQRTSFKCQNLATIADNGKRQATLITWSTNFFGDKFTPQNRCLAVSDKINQAVAANGGSLKNLLLTNGPVNGQMAICYVNGGATGCNSTNMLFTLKPENARRAGEVLATLLNFSVTGTGTINEAAGDQVYVNLEQWANQALGSEEQAAPVVSSPIEQPVAVPAPSQPASDPNIF